MDRDLADFAVIELGCLGGCVLFVGVLLGALLVLLGFFLMGS